MDDSAGEHQELSRNQNALGESYKSLRVDIFLTDLIKEAQ